MYRCMFTINITTYKFKTDNDVNKCSSKRRERFGGQIHDKTHLRRKMSSGVTPSRSISSLQITSTRFPGLQALDKITT